MHQVSLDEHVAGLGSGHPRPPGDLSLPPPPAKAGAGLLGEWVEPYYLDALAPHAAPSQAGFAAAARRATPELLATLLGEADWRPRLVAARMIALRQAREFEDHLGRLLLRSDTCYAGRGYVLALTSFATPTAAEFLARYLAHYLTLPQCDFEQAEAFAALRRLDPARAAALQPAWETFSPHHAQRLAQAEAGLTQQLDALLALRAAPTPAPTPALRILPVPRDEPASTRPWWRRWFGK